MCARASAAFRASMWHVRTFACTTAPCVPCHLNVSEYARGRAARPCTCHTHASMHTHAHARTRAPTNARTHARPHGRMHARTH
eukprot:7801968-Alexandrium_andersonii.AAC.1